MAANKSEPRKVTRHLDTLREKARTHTVRKFSDNEYKVISGKSGSVYTVTIRDEGTFCTCDWSLKRADSKTGEIPPSACSHTIAVFEHIALGNHRVATLHSADEDVSRQKRPVMDFQDGVKAVSRRGHYKQANFLDKVE